MNDFIDNEFPNLSADEQHRFATTVRQIARPELTVVEEPLQVVHKGRPKESPNKRFLSGWEHVDKTLDNTPPKKQRGCPPKVPTPPKTTKAPATVKKSREKKVLNPAEAVRASTNHARLLSSFPYIEGVPRCMVPYMTRFTDVQADGNCGFRAVALATSGLEKNWYNVRQRMLTFLNRDPALHAQNFFHHTLEDMRRRLNWLNVYEFAMEDYWFTAMEMGFLVAQTFLRPFVCLCTTIHQTFLPLRKTQDVMSEGVIYLQFLPRERHYIWITLHSYVTFI